MNYLINFYSFFYYRFWNWVLPKKKLFLDHNFEKTKNLFIYFDYEREFGGHETKISDADINNILLLLDKRFIKTTWFTVGEIFTKYSESVKNILNHGHEIGSHTYNHISPKAMSQKSLKRDFKQFYEKSSPLVIVKGFHSPRGRWSYKMFKLMNKHGYSYDVVTYKKNKPLIPILIFHNTKKILRLHTIGDDWPLFMSNFDENKVQNYFINLVEKIKVGEIAGLGFHPWILFSNKKILLGFIKLLDYLKKQENIRCETAYFYAKSVAEINKFNKY